MKKFLIIGSANAITYKEIFPYIASGEWFIRSANGKISFIMRFTTSDGEERNVPSLWYTNLDSRHLYQSLELTKKYDPEKYPKYENYDAIEVSRIKDIPYDYDGVMGVPISIVLFSPTQFEIIGITENADYLKPLYIDGNEKYDRPYINGRRMYPRILIKRVSKKMKKFLIIGNMNAIGHKEIFPYIKNNKLWIGVSFNKSKWFKVPDYYEKMDNASGKEEKGEKYILVKGIAWFTNMKYNKRNEPLILTKKYNPEKYPKYDNYDAINVDKVKDIPMDYDGVMGVPITFLGKYCPEQFEIIGVFNHYKLKTSNIELGRIDGTPVKVATTKSLFRGPVVNGKATYARILIKKK